MSEETKSPEMEVVKEEVPKKTPKKEIKKVTPPADVEAQTEETVFSLEEQELIRRQRAQRQKILDCKKEVDEALKKYGCVLKINPNSPIAAPQIMIDLP